MRPNIPILVQADWLRDTVNLLYAMANEGSEFPGCVDPAELMCTIAEDLGYADTLDPWQTVLDKLHKKTATECCHRTRLLGAPCPAGRNCPHD